MITPIRIIQNTVLPILVLVGAVMGFKALVASREPPPRATPEDHGTLVETDTAQADDAPREVRANGQVTAARRLTVMPEVAGRVVALHPNLEVGGHIAAGEEVFRIAGRDYEIAVDRANAGVRQAQAALDIERGQQRVAEREWAIFRDDLGDVGESPLAVREPQVRSAEIAVELAEAELDRARLDRSRTRFEAPFNAMVLDESAEVGALVSAQTPLATLVGTDTFWIEVSVPFAALASIAIPGMNATTGSPVSVEQDVGGTRVVREGRVERLLGEVTGVGRMARVLVAVDDPLQQALPPEDRATPLLLGAYVNVRFEAPSLEQVVRVPRAALHEGDRVYVAVDGVLEVRTVEIGWRDAENVYVTHGLVGGEEYITSPIPIAVDGMRLRVAEAAGADDV